MPIIEISAEWDQDSGQKSKLIESLKENCAKALDTTADNIWVQFNTRTAENLSSDHPPVVKIMANTGRTADQKTEFVKSVAETIAAGLGLKPKQIWIHYQEIDPKNIYFNS